MYDKLFWCMSDTLMFQAYRYRSDRVRKRMRQHTSQATWIRRVFENKEVH